VWRDDGKLISEHEDTVRNYTWKKDRVFGVSGEGSRYLEREKVLVGLLKLLSLHEK
jgi:hypothetical protein